MARVYPHPELVVPQTFTARLKPDAAYSRTVSSRAAFDTTTDAEAELLEEIGAMSDGRRAFDSPITPGPTAHWRYAAEVLADSPVGYYRFNEMPAASTYAGTMSNNLGSSGGTMADFASPWNRTTGPTSDVGYAPIMGATGTGVMAPQGGSGGAQNIFNTNKPITLECWYYRATGGRAAGDMIWATSHNADGRPYAYFQRTVTSGTGAFAFEPNGNVAGGTVSWTAIPYATWPDATWTHVAMTWSGATKNAELFINGAKYGSTQTASIDIPGLALYGLLIGGWYAASAVWYTTVGNAIDEIALYDGVLSSARIAAHYAAR